MARAQRIDVTNANGGKGVVLMSARGKSEPQSFLVVVPTTGGFELLGEDQTLGEGVAVAADDRLTFTLAGGEVVYAAANPTVVGVQVFQLRSA